PSHQLKYRLWREQNKQSPYTAQTITLEELFTPSYQIEHVIPQKVYYDNSLSNKVVCEAEVNSDKGARLGFAYIQSEGGKTLQIDGREVALLSPDQYSEWVKRTYGSSFALKAEKLLAEQIEDVVEDFSSRQLNDTRYINKVVMRLLSNVVRDADEKESTSKHLIPCTGKVTTALKRQWELNQVWDKLIQDRFERLNELTATQDYGVWKDNRFQIRVPQDLQAGFSKKRIDHRHHAMDALVIACASRSHIHYINNVAGQEDKKKYEDIHYALRSKLCEKKYADKNNYEYVFKKPWEAFTTDAWEALEQLIVSHKQNTRVLTQTTNYTEYINAAGKR
ncbi:MAG: type II CRISPR RNA-guided endonuclease Cas9, partial [Bacteroides sp.]